MTSSIIRSGRHQSVKSSRFRPRFPDGQRTNHFHSPTSVKDTAMNRSTPPDVTASAWTILIRLQVGLMVFFPEGIQKLIHPDILGAGRFARIGIPFPDLMGPFVGVVETVC